MKGETVRGTWARRGCEPVREGVGVSEWEIVEEEGGGGGRRWGTYGCSSS